MSGQGDLFGDPERGAVADHSIPKHGDKLPVRKGIDLPGQRPLGVAVHAGAFINPTAELDDAGNIRQRGIADIQALIRIGKRGHIDTSAKALICPHLWWSNGCSSS